MNLASVLIALPGLLQTEMTERKIPGATIAIVHEGRVVYAAGFGVASTESAEPVRAEMLFRAGSTTKMMTAMALVKLSTQGKIRLTEPLGDVAPELHASLRRLTASQLLSHTSGLIPDTAMAGSHDDEALAKNVAAWDERRFKQPPGQGYLYSNHGYALAGYLVEKLAGKPFADTMEEQVFRPVGMRRTTFRPLVAMTWPLAQGHDDKTGVVIRPAADAAGFWPAGSMFTNVHELGAFAAAFMDGRPDRGIIETMTTPRVEIPQAKGAQYGYGLVLDSKAGLRRWSHTGSRAGYGSNVVMIPQRRFAIVLMTNASGGNLPKTLGRIQDLLFSDSPSAP